MKPRTIHTLESLKKRTIEVGECWEWQGYFGNKVPAVCNDGKMISVRRLFSDLLDGKHPAGGFIVPKCENIKCVNPDHSKHMTHSKFAAMSGKKAKGSLTRKVKIQAFRHTFNAKLDWEKADEIRVSTEPSRQIAARFGVDKSLVCKIRAGKAWIRYNTPFAGLLR
jgi:hypothetical protein